MSFSSAGDKQVAAYLDLPKERSDELSVDDWIAAVLTPLGAEVVEKTATMAKAVIKGDVGAERFPLKLRDEATNLGFSLLRNKSKL